METKLLKDMEHASKFVEGGQHTELVSKLAASMAAQVGTLSSLDRRSTRLAA